MTTTNLNRACRIGLLDLCPRYPDASAAEALDATVQMARRAESFGYHRYWLAEHHSPRTGHCCPEILVPVVAAATTSIRVGTAGVLLRHYSPVKVASTFRMLHAIYPGRIDLGLARASADAERAPHLGVWPEPYERQVADLLDSFCDAAPAPALPLAVPPPEIWVLGTGGGTMRLAAAHGCCFCLAAFLDFGRSVPFPEVFQSYRDQFRPGRLLDTPYSAIAVAGICAESEARARALLADYRHVMTVVPTLVGTPARCKEELERMRETYGVDEIIFLDVCRRLEDRVRSSELLAAAVGLRASRPETGKTAAA
jgi:luciferase family oxidoreductase group 1